MGLKKDYKCMVLLMHSVPRAAQVVFKALVFTNMGKIGLQFAPLFHSLDGGLAPTNISRNLLPPL
jgi:hypothetical protein